MDVLLKITNIYKSLNDLRNNVHMTVETVISHACVLYTYAHFILWHFLISYFDGSH